MPVLSALPKFGRLLLFTSQGLITSRDGSAGITSSKMMSGRNSSAMRMASKPLFAVRQPRGDLVPDHRAVDEQPIEVPAELTVLSPLSVNCP